MRHVFFCLAIIAGVAACGGEQSSDAARPASPMARRDIRPSDLPELTRCLGKLDAALQRQAAQRDIDLSCASGTYRGATASGRACLLRVDAETGRFRFEVEREVVEIRWESTAFSAQGKPVSNLEEAGTPGQPGVQLTRYTGGAQPVTEALVLRAGGGRPALPRMVYQRTAGDQTSFTVCQFGS